MAKKKYYVVWSGYRPGVYTEWGEAERQIKGFAGARFQGFPSRAAAEAAFREGPGGKTTQAVNKSAKKSGSSKKIPPRIPNSLSVDAACSGNPGPMEYQGVMTGDGRRIFHQAFPKGTNNIGEFLALVHALALLQAKDRPTMPIYTDSKIAMGWVSKKKAKTKLERNAQTEQLFQMMERAEKWLRENTFRNPIYKWPTDVWGEIPADFGRK